MKIDHWKHSIQSKMLCFFSILLIAACVSLTLVDVSIFNSVYLKRSNEYLSDVVALAMTNENNYIADIEQMSVSVLTDKTVQKNLVKINEFEKRKGNLRIGRLKEKISAAVRAEALSMDGVVSLRIYSLNGEETIVGTTLLDEFELSLEEADVYKANGKNLWVLADGASYICACRAILDLSSMQPIGYMMIICDHEHFSSKLQTFNQRYASRVYMVDERGRVAAANDQEVIGSVFPYEVEELKKEWIQKRMDPFAGEMSYYFFPQDLDNGWTMVATVSIKQYQSALHFSILCVNVILLLILLLAFVITVKETKRLTDPVRQLLVSMSDFGKGNLATRVRLETKDEIGLIGKAYNQMADKIQNLLETVYAMEIAKKEAEIEFLKMQINPHFLYNTLDTLSWMGISSGNESVSDISVSLARLLRANVKNDSFITVEEEMCTVRDYLQIQHYRFGDKMLVKYEVDIEASECYMPNFLLQPLIENSIVHGIENLNGLGEIFIQIQVMDDDWIKFMVSDNGIGMTERQKEQLMAQCMDFKSKNAIGLKNVYRRLQLMYGQSCQFMLESALGSGTCISFRIPVKKEVRSEENASEAEV